MIDLADIEPRFRHGMIGQLFKHLEPGHSLLIVVDHDPQRLRFHLDFAFGTLCDWAYLEQGPDVWRVRLRHVQKRMISKCRQYGRSVRPIVAAGNQRE